MRKDQITRLDELTEKLADVVLDEADPDFWPGNGVPLADLTQQQRGDRYWCKKNAAASMALLERLQRTVSDATGGRRNNGTEEAEEELDREIADAEKRAAKLLDEVQKKAAAAGRGS